MLELLKNIYTQLTDMEHAIVYEMEDMDTPDWHNSVKYQNADLNALYVLINCTKVYTEQLIETYEELE